MADRTPSGVGFLGRQKTAPHAQGKTASLALCPQTKETQAPHPQEKSVKTARLRQAGRRKAAVLSKRALQGSQGWTPTVLLA